MTLVLQKRPQILIREPNFRKGYSALSIKYQVLGLLFRKPDRNRTSQVCNAVRSPNLYNDSDGPIAI